MPEIHVDIDAPFSIRSDVRVLSSDAMAGTAANQSDRHKTTNMLRIIFFIYNINAKLAIITEIPNVFNNK